MSSESDVTYTVIEVARMLKLHPETVRRWARTRRLRAIHASRKTIRIPRAEVLRG